MTTTARAENDLEVVRAALGDDYDVITELGRGGMAMVYRARERQLEREVAIKVLPFTLALDAELIERFQREARLSAQLEHPNIVPIYRVGRSGPVIYFVMKLLRGQSLSALVSARGRLPAADVRRVLSETASALGYAHQHGVVHRDVKPDNIMLDTGGRCVVTDFGIARSAADTKLTAAGMSLGTPRYMSPEQARAGELDGRSDLYSLGIVGYECLVGRPPFDSGDAMSILLDHVQTPVPRPTIASMGSADERSVFDAIERLLAKRPEDRFQTAEEFIAALRNTGSASGRVRASTVPVSPSATSDLAGRAPQSSAALDSALAAGIELLRQQRPKLEAGLAAGRRLLNANAPRMRAAATRAANGAGHGVAEVGSVMRPRFASVATWLRSRTRHFWAAVIGGAVGCWLTYAVGHYAFMQRSRCPKLSASSGDDSATSLAMARPRPFTVMTDPVGSLRHGSDLDVYYDVCGLSEGTIKTRITVTRSESGLRRLFGDGVEPVTVSNEDAVTGPAMRRHQSIEFGEMPAGTYALDIVVKDERGRVREADLTFRVSGR